jgi:hypothetical protein
VNRLELFLAGVAENRDLLSFFVSTFATAPGLLLLLP